MSSNIKTIVVLDDNHSDCKNVVGRIEHSFESLWINYNTSRIEEDGPAEKEFPMNKSMGITSMIPENNPSPKTLISNMIGNMPIYNEYIQKDLGIFNFDEIVDTKFSKFKLPMKVMEFLRYSIECENNFCLSTIGNSHYMFDQENNRLDVVLTRIFSCEPHSVSASLTSVQDHYFQEISLKNAVSLSVQKPRRMASLENLIYLHFDSKEELSKMIFNKVQETKNSLISLLILKIQKEEESAPIYFYIPEIMCNEFTLNMLDEWMQEKLENQFLNSLLNIFYQKCMCIFISSIDYSILNLKQTSSILTITSKINDIISIFPSNKSFNGNNSFFNKSGLSNDQSESEEVIQEQSVVEEVESSTDESMQKTKDNLEKTKELIVHLIEDKEEEKDQASFDKSMKKERKKDDEEESEEKEKEEVDLLSPDLNKTIKNGKSRISMIPLDRNHWLDDEEEEEIGEVEEDFVKSIIKIEKHDKTVIEEEEEQVTTEKSNEDSSTLSIEEERKKHKEEIEVMEEKYRKLTKNLLDSLNQKTSEILTLQNKFELNKKREQEKQIQKNLLLSRVKSHDDRKSLQIAKLKLSHCHRDLLDYDNRVDIALLKARIFQLEEEGNDLEDDVTCLKKQLDEANKSLTKNKKSLDKKQDMISKLEDQLNYQLEEQKDLKDKTLIISEKNGQVDILKEQLKEKEKQVNETKKKLNNLKKNLQEGNSELESKVKELERSLKDKDQRVQSAQKKREKKEKELEEVQRKFQILKKNQNLVSEKRKSIVEQAEKRISIIENIIPPKSRSNPKKNQTAQGEEEKEEENSKNKKKIEMPNKISSKKNKSSKSTDEQKDDTPVASTKKRGRPRKQETQAKQKKRKESSDEEEEQEDVLNKPAKRATKKTTKKATVEEEPEEEDSEEISKKEEPKKVKKPKTKTAPKKTAPKKEVAKKRGRAKKVVENTENEETTEPTTKEIKKRKNQENQQTEKETTKKPKQATKKPKTSKQTESSKPLQDLTNKQEVSAPPPKKVTKPLFSGLGKSISKFSGSSILQGTLFANSFKVPKLRGDK